MSSDSSDASRPDSSQTNSTSPKESVSDAPSAIEAVAEVHPKTPEEVADGSSQGNPSPSGEAVASDSAGGVTDPGATSPSPEQFASGQAAPDQAAPDQAAAADANAIPPQRANPHDPLAKRKIQIGSRLGMESPRTAKPKVAGTDKPVKVHPDQLPHVKQPVEEQAPKTEEGPPPKVPKPSVRDPLSPELEAELDAALGGASLDQLMSGTSGGAPSQLLDLETRHAATVVNIHADNVFLTLGGQNEAVVSVRQFAEPPEIGSRVNVVVKAFNAEDGIYEVTVSGASINVEDWSDLTEGTVVEARVTGSNTGGLECMVNNIRGFIPVSQIALYRIEDMAEFVDQRLQCLVTEVNPQRKNLVLSRRAVLEREKQEQREKLLEELEVGQVRDGVVRNIRDFGAFVDLGGVDGLVHVSQLSWERVNHPSEVLEEGQKVRAKIEKIDPATGKIGLSIRSLEEDPWAKANSEFPVGSVVAGTVTRIAKFGAFVKLGIGVEGLIHISELAHSRVANVSSVVREGQAVNVKVLSVDTEAQRIALSLKATLEAPASEKAEEEDDTPRELAVKPQQSGPLKGGTDRPSGGDQFGLKW